MKKINLLIGTFIAISGATNAQTLISSAGGTSETDQYQISWSVGEVAISTYEGSEYVVTQGFHQSWAEVTAIDKVDQNMYNISLYPNPVAHDLIIKNEDQKILQYKIIDMSGAVISTGTIRDRKSSVSFEKLAPGSYFMQLFEDSKKAGNYKIIKY